MLKILLLATALSTIGQAAMAGHDHDELSDQDRARAALETGRAVPLQDILDQASRDFDGKMIQVELEEHNGLVFYEVKLLTDEGRVVKLRYDARSGALLNGSDPHVAATRRK